jgi:predicted transcriptional regulator
MIPALKEALKAVESWPEENQEALAAAAREIEAQMTGVYHPTAEELVAIDRGLEAADRGEFASDEEVAAIKAKFRSG